MRIEKINFISKQKFFGYLFLSLLLMHMVAPILLFFPVKKHFLKYANRVLQRSDKTLFYLDLTIEEFAAYKVIGHNELVIKGEYYDFKDLRIEGGMVRVFVYHDKMESEFQKNIANLFNEKSKDGQQKLNFISKIFDLFYINILINDMPFLLSLSHSFHTTNNLYSFSKLNQFFDPPEIKVVS